MPNTEQPKMKMIKLTTQEGKGRLTELTGGGLKIRVKMMGQNYYGYGDPYVKYNLEEGIIKAELAYKNSYYSHNYFTKDQVEKFLAWAKDNCSWHNLKINRILVSTSKVDITDDFQIPSVDNVQFKYLISGAFHIKMTDKQRAHIEAILTTRKEKKAELLKKQAQQRKVAAAKKKQNDAIYDALENSDVAIALEILRKRGLKVVTVDQGK